MSVQIINADVLDGLHRLPDRSVQCCITSPPYWGLRNYGVEGQIGLEPTPEEYVARLVEVFREVHRVLRDDGTLWLNLGDTFASAWAVSRRSVIGAPPLTDGSREHRPNRLVGGLKEKDLVGIPWRVAFALQEDGWYLRSDVIWHKPNPMPESVRDRPTKAHEYMFLLAKSQKYFYDADAVREPHKQESLERLQRKAHRLGHKWEHAPGNQTIANDLSKACHPNGRNRRDVWTIPTRPYKGAHFATFPPALVEPCLLAGTSEAGRCPVCGAPWVREVVREHVGASILRGSHLVGNGRGSQGNVYAIPHESAKVISSGWRPSCDHDAAPVPCTVLDPFGGSGTVGAVATAHGRDAVLIELNPDYISLIEKRVAEVRA